MDKLSKADQVKVEEYRKVMNRKLKPSVTTMPSVTADIIAVRPAYSELSDDEWRRNPKFALELLLIRRGAWPYEGELALPGGFIRPDESVEEGARRELREETALKAHPLIPIGVFSKPGRDMRAWIMSNAFVCIYRRGEGCRVKGGDDAASAKWLRVENPIILNGRFTLPFFEDGKHIFTLEGSYAEDGLIGGRFLSVKKNPLAFDHAEIIATAFLRMMAFDKKQLAFLFLPEKFTLANYIDVYQYLTRYNIEDKNIPNFRRQLTETQNPLLEVCEGEFETGRGHARAKLYRRSPNYVAN